MDEIRNSDCSSNDFLPWDTIGGKVEAEPIVVEVDQGSSESLSSLRGFSFLFFPFFLFSSFGQTRRAYLLTYRDAHLGREK